MSNQSNQYLLYTAFVLGSIGAYGTLAPESPTENSGSNSSNSELQAIADRVLSVETYIKNKKDSAKRVSADPNATPQEVAESVLQRLDDVESSAFSNDQKIFTLRTDVDQNTTDISFNAGDFQGQITTNKTHADGIETTADGNTSDIIDIIKPDLSLLAGNISQLSTDTTNLSSRLDTIELARPLEATARETLGDDIASVSGRVTTNLDSIQSIEDDLELVYTENISSNAEAIGALVDHTNYLSERLRADDDGVTCLQKFKAHNGVDIALSESYLRLGYPNNDEWMIYTGTLAPGGKAAVKGFGFSGKATRVRVRDNSAQGFLIENSNDERLMSIRGSDAYTHFAGEVQVGSNGPRTFAYSNTAFFGHRTSSRDNCALQQASDGKTVIATPSKASVNVDGGTMLMVESDKTHVKTELKITQSPYDTHFNKDAGGTNVISSNYGTFFRTGTSASTVTIKNREININGTDVLAKMNRLQTDLDALEKTVEDDCIKHEEYIRIRNKANGKYIRKGNSNNDIIADNTTKDDKAKFTIYRR